MQRARKSTLGTHGVRPVRINFMARSPKSPLGTSPSISLGVLRQTPRLGCASGRKVSAVKMTDLSSRELSCFFSSKKKATPKSQPVASTSTRTRRCLYQTEEDEEASQVRKEIPKIVLNESRIPRPGMAKLKPDITKRNSAAHPGISNSNSVHPMNTRKKQERKVQKPTASGTSSRHLVKNHTVSTDPSCNCTALSEILNQMKQMGEEQKSMLQQIANDQKKMFQDATNLFSEVLSEQKSIMKNMGKILELHNVEVSRRASDQEFSAIEHMVQNDSSVVVEPALDPKRSRGKSLGSEKENVIRNSRKSLAAYREMRKSFGYLATPTLSARKPRTPKVKTPRSALSAKLQIQLEDLLDD